MVSAHCDQYGQCDQWSVWSMVSVVSDQWSVVTVVSLSLAIADIMVAVLVMPLAVYVEVSRYRATVNFNISCSR